MVGCSARNVRREAYRSSLPSTVLFRHETDEEHTVTQPPPSLPSSQSVPRFILCLHPFPPHTLHHDRLIHPSLSSPFLFFFFFLPLILLTSFHPPGGCLSPSFPCLGSGYEKGPETGTSLRNTEWIDAADFCQISEVYFNEEFSLLEEEYFFN